MAGAFQVGPVGLRFSGRNGPPVLERVCDQYRSHAHKHDHTTLVLAGSVLISWAGGERELGLYESMEVPAGVEHTIKAREPMSRWVCIFSHRDFDGRVLQHYVGHPHEDE